MNATLTNELNETKEFAQVVAEQAVEINTVMIEKYVDSLHGDESYAFKYGVMLAIVQSLLRGDKQAIALYRTWILAVNQP